MVGYRAFVRGGGIDAYFWARQKVVFTFQQLKKKLVYLPPDKNLALIPTFKILTKSLVGHPVDVMMWTRECVSTTDEWNHLFFFGQGGRDPTLFCKYFGAGSFQHLNKDPGIR